jgi:hypothetical protein
MYEPSNGSSSRNVCMAWLVIGDTADTGAEYGTTNTTSPPEALPPISERDAQANVPDCSKRPHDPL